MSSDPIPVRDSLSDIYSSSVLLPQGQRWDALAAKFKETYGEAPQYVARAPGRVNVIGEHVDHAGFSVLPAAIEKDVIIAARVTRTTGSSKVTIRVANTNSKYPPDEFSYSSGPDGWNDVVVNRKQKSWVNYLKAGLRGLLSNLASTDHVALQSPPSTIDLLYSGTVPAGGGLSSSAAMTTSSSLAILYAYQTASETQKQEVSRKQVTEVAIISEREVGVNSGGMDQAASVFGEKGKVLHIEFTPTLSPTPIAIPASDPPVSFVIVNTLVTADKHVTAKIHYNLRVVENRVGARLLARHLKLSPPSGDSGWDFGKVLHAQSEKTESEAERKDRSPKKQAERLEKMAKVAEDALGGEDGMTWHEVLKELEMDEKTFDDEVKGGYEVEAPDGKLKLLKRARHVFSEARRVYLMRLLLESPPSPSSRLAEDMGALMNASQASCSKDYDCSCPEIEEVAKIAKTAGALGSRLTGAGWGGSTVHLVPESEEASFIEEMRKEYFAQRFPDLSADDLESACFATKPESGACIVKL